MHQAADSPTAAPMTTSKRRHFLARLATILIGGIVAVFPLAVGWGVLFHPLRRRTRVNPVGAEGDAAEEFVRVCPLDALPADGVPRPFVVINHAIDAWTHTPAQRSGLVFLTRTDAAGQPKVTALSATCPHLGCVVEWTPAEDEFECPCHESGFDKDGKKLFGPSPRNLDPLPVKIVAQNGQTDVLVAYQTFRTGIADRKPA